ncbi:MAG: phenylalanine--tRNA ligase subunit beta [Acidimicrobiia bacterium]
MLLPLSWLRDFVDVDLSVDDLVLLLGDLGTPVESVTHVGAGLDGVVVARVTEIGAIAGADKIRRVLVDAGGDEPVQVVCGAWNFDVGDLVPLATVGTVLPGDFAIARRKMKGVESHGMLCAPDELGLPEGGHEGILLLPGGLVPGTPFAEAMGIVPDVVLELEVNPNRPDAMYVAGIGRDVAARLGLPFRTPSPGGAGADGPSTRPAGAGPVTVDPVTVDPVTVEPVTVEVADLVACPRFTARVVTGITVGPSPAWLADRLAKAGMRPINNVVDASNYVMLELGHPNHAYDLAALPGRGLRVRRAAPGESLVTLDGVERSFVADDLLICDAGDPAVGIAGIMGGESSEVTGATTEVLLEAAAFDPMTIAWTSKRLGLRSEASARFEKGVDPHGIDLAVARFCELLAAGGATPTGVVVDVRGDLDEPVPVPVRTARVNALLGTSLTDAEVRGHLDPIGFTTSVTAPGLLDVTIPTWRPDSAAEIDVIEEIARMHGYARIPRTVPASTLIGELAPVQRDRREVRSILVGAGASEAWTTTFLAAADLSRAGLDPAVAVVVANPLAVEESRLRTSLLPGLLRAVAYNASHRLADAWLFELGNVFSVVDRGSLPDERERLGVALAGADARTATELWHLLAEGLFLEQARLRPIGDPAAGRAGGPLPGGLHPARVASVEVDGAAVGVVGEVDPAVLEGHGITQRVGWLELDLGPVLAARRGPVGYRPVRRFPSSDVDLSFEVDEGTPAGEVTDALASTGADEVVAVSLLDVYRGPGIAEGRRSLTYRVRLQAADRTLTDTELAELRQRLIAAVASAAPATLRA